ncbi:MAG: hypothetical protein ACYDC3_15815, partial [Candidatus Binataceae bacterium]
NMASGTSLVRNSRNRAAARTRQIPAGATRGSKRQDAQMFAICLDNCGYDFSLQVCKVYRILPDPVANKHRLLRVIDDTGEDYLYVSNMFAPIRLSTKARAAFAHPLDELDSQNPHIFGPFLRIAARVRILH